MNITENMRLSIIKSRLIFNIQYFLTFGYHRSHLGLQMVQWPNMLMTQHNLKLKKNIYIYTYLN
jgi:hypothetical protein